MEALQYTGVSEGVVLAEHFGARSSTSFREEKVKMVDHILEDIVGSSAGEGESDIDISDVENFNNDDESEQNPTSEITAHEQLSEHSAPTAERPAVGNSSSTGNELREIKEVMLEVKDLLSEFIKQSAQQRTTPAHVHMAGGEFDTTFSSTSTGSDGGINSTPKRTNKQISLNIRVSILSKFCIKLLNHISQQETRRVYNTLIEEEEFSGWNLSEQLVQYENCWYN